MCVSTHVHSLLWGADVLVTKVPCVYEATETVFQPCPHPNALTRATAIVKVLPHLYMYSRELKESSTK